MFAFSIPKNPVVTKAPQFVGPLGWFSIILLLLHCFRVMGGLIIDFIMIVPNLHTGSLQFVFNNIIDARPGYGANHLIYHDFFEMQFSLTCVIFSDEKLV
jgi:hypothetical protein